MIYLYVNDRSLLESANDLIAITHASTIVTELPSADIYLQLDKNGLAIVSTEFGITYVKDLYNKLLDRLKKTGSELLIQSIKSTDKLNILDVTAGLGRDAILMANAGYNVTMIEKNPALAIILNYIIKYKITPGTDNLRLAHMDSIEYLQQNFERSLKKQIVSMCHKMDSSRSFNDMLVAPDIIYMDPMFQDNSKAKSKKAMQLIDMLLHADIDYVSTDNIKLFELAHNIALNKIIVKRDNKQKPLVANPSPSYSKSGKTVRYDIYVK